MIDIFICDIRGTNWHSAGFVQDPDVLDTWFSSALWPISTLGWPDPRKFPKDFPEGDAALHVWNPSSVLSTAREILTLWVSRMVMFNLYFRGCLPFRDVFVHAMIQDGHGQKMSKSLGNGVDPLDIIHSHGSDAMRFTMAQMTTQTQDVRLPVDMVCPHHEGETFAPKTITTHGGYTVAAPVQECPSNPKLKMTSSFGASSGQATPTAEAPLARNTSTKFDLGRNFANKLWNAVRFALGNLEQPSPSPRSERPGEGGERSEPGEGTPGDERAHSADSAMSLTRSPSHVPSPQPSPGRPSGAGRGGLSLADRWILSRLAAVVRDSDAALSNFEFSGYAQGLYDFTWRDLCDWYIEAVKPTVKENPAQRAVLASCIDVTLRLLHPVMPFVTEKLWEALNATVQNRGGGPPGSLLEKVNIPASSLLITAAWPRVDASLIDPAAESQFEFLRGVISSIREAKNTYKIAPRQKLTVSSKASGELARQLEAGRDLIGTLAAVDLTDIGPATAKPADAATVIVAGTENYLHGLVRADAEKSRLTKRREELTKSRIALQGRMASKSYTEKAPPHLVQQTRDQLAAVEKELATVEEQLAAL